MFCLIGEGVDWRVVRILDSRMFVVRCWICRGIRNGITFVSEMRKIINS